MFAHSVALGSSLIVRLRYVGSPLDALHDNIHGVGAMDLVHKLIT